MEVLVASGYRSYREQSGTYEWFKDAYGEEAGKLSVPPGHSEHQLGTAVDFTSSQVDYELVTDFGQNGRRLVAEKERRPARLRALLPGRPGKRGRCPPRTLALSLRGRRKKPCRSKPPEKEPLQTFTAKAGRNATNPRAPRIK